MKGALHNVLFNSQSTNSYRTVMIYSLAQKYGFSLDTPFNEYPKHVRDILFYGTNGETVDMVQPPFMHKRNWCVGRKRPFRGFINELESWYRNHIRKAGNADAYEPSFVKEAMIEMVCPDCHGSRLKSSRLAVTVGGMDINALSMMLFPALIAFLDNLDIPCKQRDAADSKGYTAVDFSLTHANGARCEHCAGDGILVTNLQFMADIESICPVCKGGRFSQVGLDIRYGGKNIAEILEMTVEEAFDFFADEKPIRHKLGS